MIHGTCAVEEECYIGVTAFNCGIALPGYYLAAGAGEEMERLFSRLQEESVLKKSGWQLIAQGILLKYWGSWNGMGNRWLLRSYPEGKARNWKNISGKILAGTFRYSQLQPMPDTLPLTFPGTLLK